MYAILWSITKQNTLFRDIFFLVPMGDVIIIESRFVHHWKGKKHVSSLVQVCLQLQLKVENVHLSGE